MTQLGDKAFYPGRAPIDAYGDGGFRFAGMSHVGSLMCLPDGIHGWDARVVDDIARASLGAVFDAAESIDVVLIGTGEKHVFLAPSLRDAFRDVGVVVESMSTGAAARTYNVLLGEERAVGVALLAVGTRAP